MQDNLVTVCVVTYNSMPYVESTLESIKAQTFKNIELVVSDDCSTDNTIPFVKVWVEKNKDHFINCIVLSSQINTGVSGNCNRAVDASHGEWIKIIAGDDILMKDCIEKNLFFVSENKEAKVVFSKLQRFVDSENGRKLLDSSSMELLAEKFNRSTKEQYDLLFKEMFCTAPSSFIKKDIFERFRFLEDYPLFEDLPFYHTLLKNNIHLYFLNSYTVYYRCQESIQRSKTYFYNEKYENCRFAFYFNERRQLLLEKHSKQVAKSDQSYILYKFIMFLNRNRANFPNKIIRKCLLEFIRFVFFLRKNN